MELVIAIVITIVVYAVVTGFALFDIRRVRRFSSDADADADVRTTANSRVSPPSDPSVYTFKTDSKLKVEEWKFLINAGWEFVTSNTETYTDYAGCYPDAPEFTKTCWHYVFRKKQSADSD